MPGGLELHDRLQPRQRIAVHGRARHALDRLGGELVDRRRQRRIARRVDDRVDVAMAAQRASAARPSARRAGSGPRPGRRRRPRPRRGPAHAAASGGRPARRPSCPRPAPGATSRIKPSTSGSSGASTATTPVGSGVEKRQVRPGDRVDAAHDRRELVRPARVVDEQVDGGAELGAALLGPAGELLGARLERLGEAVQDLPAVVGGLLRPAAGRGARDLDRVADVLARPARHVDARRSDRSGRTQSARTRLPHRACTSWRRRGGAHALTFRYGSRPDGPPSRPNPLSL